MPKKGWNEFRQMLKKDQKGNESAEEARKNLIERCRVSCDLRTPRCIKNGWRRKGEGEGGRGKGAFSFQMNSKTPQILSLLPRMLEAVAKLLPPNSQTSKQLTKALNDRKEQQNSSNGE